MTSKDEDQFDDEFEAFLHGRDDLSRHLQSLKQPEPSAELDAAILAQVEAELAREKAMLVAANDPAISGMTGVRPSFLGRWRAPLALAASVLFACLIILRWQTQSEQAAPLVVAEAPQAARQEAPAAPAAAAPSAVPPVENRVEPRKQAETKQTVTKQTAKASPAADKAKLEQSSTPSADTQIAAAPAEASTALRKEAEPPMQIAQADTREYAPRAPAPAPPTAAASAPAPAPAPAATPAPVAGRAMVADSSVNAEKAKAWLALIDELLKADLRQDALVEWDKFRKAYPQYPVPEKTEARIKALKK